jgi:glycosyltransferase involved in cell wall biosynthesis
MRKDLGLEGRVVVGAACALRDRKRVDDFIDLALELSSRHPQVIGLIAGGPVAGERKYGERVSARLRDLHEQRKLVWLGHLEPVEPVYHACDVFVSTSEYETFGMSVCEAMACARPVAAYRGGSVAEVVGDAGLIVETGDLAALTAAVERLVVDGELRQRLGQAARQRVAEHFNPRKSFRQLCQIYESLVAGRRSKKNAVVAR